MSLHTITILKNSIIPLKLQFSSTSISMTKPRKYINMNKRKTQYVSKKQLGGKKPEGINIAAILEAVETEREAQYQY